MTQCIEEIIKIYHKKRQKSTHTQIYFFNFFNNWQCSKKTLTTSVFFFFFLIKRGTLDAHLGPKSTNNNIIEK